MRTHIRTFVIVALTGGLLALFLRNADLRLVWAEILSARLDLLAAALGVTALQYVMRALRWQYLLRPIGEAKFSTTFRATVIGFAASAVLPARAGEVLRPYLLARWEGLSATATFATILLERVLDLATVVVLLALFFLFFDPGLAALNPALYRGVQIGGLMAGVAAVGALATVFLLAGHPETLGRWALRAERLLPARAARALAFAVENFIGGLAVMRQPRRLLIALALSVPLWLLITAAIWLGAAAFQIVFPFSSTLLFNALIVVGVSVPTPGGVGGFHEAFRIGATAFFGAPNDRAVGAAIVLHAISIVPVVLLGLVFMAQAGLDLAGMRRLAQRRDEDDADRAGVDATEADAAPASAGVVAIATPEASEEGRAG